MRSILGAVLIVLLVAVGGALLLATGAFEVGADRRHDPWLRTLIEFTRERAVAARSADIKVPPLNDAELRRRGAGNYAAMCAGCHLGPGLRDTELRRGLNPQPPDLAAAGRRSLPARDFWIVKHGLMATGMPAWGVSMDDDTIWAMVAFLEWLPGSNAADYAAAVAASDGHSHAPAIAKPEEPGEGTGHDNDPNDMHRDSPHQHDSDDPPKSDRQAEHGPNHKQEHEHGEKTHS